MTQDIQARLAAMSQAEVIEAALMALSPALGIANEDDARERFLALADIKGADAADIDALAAAAATDTGAVVDMLRTVLSAAADEGDLVGPDAMTETLDHVGERQIAISADMYGLGVLLISCYIAYKSKGRASSEETVIIETMEDGREKITISRKIGYQSPFDPMIKLIEAVLGHTRDD